MIEHLEKSSEHYKDFSSYANKHNCPDWAMKLRVKAFEERTWFLDRRYNKEFTMEDSYCATSQIVAEWLELDQIKDYISLIDTGKGYCKYRCKKTKGTIPYFILNIRFFSDEV